MYVPALAGAGRLGRSPIPSGWQSFSRGVAPQHGRQTMHAIVSVLRSLFATRPATHKPASRRLGLESLEERWAPATLAVSSWINPDTQPFTSKATVPSSSTDSQYGTTGVLGWSDPDHVLAR
jgi:hypothetical protein